VEDQVLAIGQWTRVLQRKFRQIPEGGRDHPETHDIVYAPIKRNSEEEKSNPYGNGPMYDAVQTFRFILGGSSGHG